MKTCTRCGNPAKFVATLEVRHVQLKDGSGMSIAIPDVCIACAETVTNVARFPAKVEGTPI